MLEERSAPTIKSLLQVAVPQELRQEQCRTILCGVPSAAIGSLAVAAVSYLVLQDNAPRLALGWFIVMVLVQSARLVLWLRTRAQANDALPVGGLSALRTVSVMAGSAWGALALPAFPLDFGDLTVVAVISSAVCGAALANLYCDLWAAWGFYLGALLPVTLRLLYLHTPIATGMGILGLLYLIYLAVTTRRLSRAFVNAFNMRQFASAQTEAMATTERRLRSMYDNAPDPVWILQNGIIVDCNPAASDALQHNEKDTFLKRHPVDFSAPDMGDRATARSQLDRHAALAMAQGRNRFEWMLQRGDGTAFWAEFTLSIFTLDQQAALYCVWRDIQERKDLEYKVQFQLEHDTLTGLYNRFALGQWLPKALEAAARNGSTVAIGLLDLDNFKPVNDIYGHAKGDRVLIEVAHCLQQSVGPHGLVARLGGDEFVWVSSGYAGDATPSPDAMDSALVQTLQRLNQSMQVVFDTPEARHAQLGMSMGIALYPSHGMDTEALLRKSDEALYVAKRSKAVRTCWWQLWTTPSGTPHAVAGQAQRMQLALFGAEAAGHLQPVETQLATMLACYFDQTMAEAAGTNADTSIFRRLHQTLTPEQCAAYRSVTLRQLETIFRPTLAADTLQRLGQAMGRECAWRGFSLSDCANFLMELQSFAQDWLAQMPMRHTEALALQHIIHGRSMRFLRAQQDGHTRLYNELQSLLTELQSHEASWLEKGEFTMRMLNRLAQIDGIAGAAAGRPDTHNRYVTEYAAGNAKGYNTDIEGSGLSLDFSASDNQALPPTMRAWVVPGIHTASNFWQDASLRGLQALAARRGFHSVAAFATHDQGGHPTITYSLWGVFPGQFESPEMRSWLASLRNFIERALQSTEYAAHHGKPISVAERSHFRSMLFGNGLSMYMQPLIDLSSGRVRKVEALARLIDDNGQIVSPGVFLPAFGAQELQRLYWKGLEQTLTWLQRWDQVGCHLNVTMNLPPAVLAHPDCLRWTREALERSGIAPARLYLELLEHEDVTHIGTRIEALNAFRTLGIHIVMDDLGAGHSSLLRLRTLPFSTVKIDQGLVKQALSDPAKTVPFVGALVSMAHGLDMDVVVEGLETTDLVEMAIGLGADVGQGYAIARPMPPEQIADWVSQWNWPIHPDAPGTALGALSTQYRNAQKLGLRARTGKNR